MTVYRLCCGRGCDLVVLQHLTTLCHLAAFEYNVHHSLGFNLYTPWNISFYTCVPSIHPYNHLSCSAPSQQRTSLPPSPVALYFNLNLINSSISRSSGFPSGLSQCRSRNRQREAISCSPLPATGLTDSSVSGGANGLITYPSNASGIILLLLPRHPHHSSSSSSL